jgi:hypothetical protein
VLNLRLMILAVLVGRSDPPEEDRVACRALDRGRMSLVRCCARCGCRCAADSKARQAFHCRCAVPQV